MEGESGVTRKIIDDLHSWDIPGDQIQDEDVVIRRIIDELHSWGIQRDQMESKSGVT